MGDIAGNTDPRVMVLAPDDNVAIAKSDIASGTTLTVMGQTVTSLTIRVGPAHPIDLAREERDIGAILGLRSSFSGAKLTLS